MRLKGSCIVWLGHTCLALSRISCPVSLLSSLNLAFFQWSPHLRVLVHMFLQPIRSLALYSHIHPCNIYSSPSFKVKVCFPIESFPDQPKPCYVLSEHHFFPSYHISQLWFYMQLIGCVISTLSVFHQTMDSLSSALQLSVFTTVLLLLRTGPGPYYVFNKCLTSKSCIS